MPTGKHSGSMGQKGWQSSAEGAPESQPRLQEGRAGSTIVQQPPAEQGRYSPSLPHHTSKVSWEILLSNRHSQRQQLLLASLLLMLSQCSQVKNRLPGPFESGRHIVLEFLAARIYCTLRKAPNPPRSKSSKTKRAQPTLKFERLFLLHTMISGQAFMARQSSVRVGEPCSQEA